MATELARHLEETIAGMNEGNPERVFLQKELTHVRAELRKREIALSINAVFGQLPGGLKLDQLLPPPVFIPSNGRVFKGDYKGMTRDEVHANFPFWEKVFKGIADPISRGTLTKITAVNSFSARLAGIVTLDDLRNADEDVISKLSSTANSPALGLDYARMIKSGFASSETPTTQVA